MKKIIYILTVAAILCGCNGYMGGFDDSDRQFTQLVFINRSSLDIGVSVNGVDWITPQDTIRLKPENGLYKETKQGEFANFKLYNGCIMHVDFGNGREIYFDSEASFPYNPTSTNQKRVYDSKGEYIIVEFSDPICDSLFKRHDDHLTFKMGTVYYPSRVVDSLCVKGSSEAYFTSLVATPQTRKSLRLGAAVSKEAASLNDIRFIEECSFEPDGVAINDSSYVPQIPYSYNYVKHYYSLENLRKFGLAHFGWDFAALTGREAGEMEKFCGVAMVSTYVNRSEYLRDTIPSEEFSKAYEESAGGIAAVDHITYGNLRILLAEGNCSHYRLLYHTEYDALEGSSYYRIPDGVEYHLITMDEDGEFVCRSGGEELVHEFNSDYDGKTIHPIIFTMTDFSGEQAWIHIPDQD